MVSVKCLSTHNSGYHNIHYLVNANSFAVLREGTLQQFDTEVCEDPLYLYLQNYASWLVAVAQPKHPEERELLNRSSINHVDMAGELAKLYTTA